MPSSIAPALGPLVCLAVALVAPVAGAVPPRVADSGAWYQLSYPAEVAGRSLRALFGAALSAEDYGATWQVYAFDADAQAYTDPGIDGTLPEGAGFWFIQATGEPVDLGGAEVPFALGRPSPACTVPEGCRESALSGADRAVGWNLAGHPFEGPVAAAAVRLVTGSGGSACAGRGCALDAAPPGLVPRATLWSWDPDAGAYADLSSATLAPWTGFWLGLGPDGRGASPSLFYPDPFCT